MGRVQEIGIFTDKVMVRERPTPDPDDSEILAGDSGRWIIDQG